MYRSRIRELSEEMGPYSSTQAAVDFASHLAGIKTDHMLELTYPERKRVHNLKYYTWVEQQGRTSEELNDQWYHEEETFAAVSHQADAIDALIDSFNEQTGLLQQL